MTIPFVSLKLNLALIVILSSIKFSQQFKPWEDHMPVVLWSIGIGIALVLLGWGGGAYLIQKSEGFAYVSIVCSGLRTKILAGPFKKGFWFHSRTRNSWISEFNGLVVKHAPELRTIGGVAVTIKASKMHYFRAALRAKKHRRLGKAGAADVLKYIVEHIGRPIPTATAELPTPSPENQRKGVPPASGTPKKDWRNAMNS
jgi:hypothetical protein